MVYRVVISNEAKREYEEIVRYLVDVLKSPQAARSFLAEFDSQVGLLREQPLIRPLSHLPELAAHGYRSFRIKKYVALYKFEDETVFIAHIFYQSQNYARLV